MELLVSISIAVLLISVSVPVYTGIIRGAAAKQADSMVSSSLKLAQVQSLITRQKVAFFVVTSVYGSDNQYASPDMINRSYFIYADDTYPVAKPKRFVTSVQSLPPPMMFDLAASNLPPEEILTDLDGNNLLGVRGFRFVPAGGIWWNDAELVASQNSRFNVVITEGLAAAGGTYTAKTSGSIIRYTNSVNTFTGKVFRP